MTALPFLSSDSARRRKKDGVVMAAVTPLDSRSSLSRLLCELGHHHVTQRVAYGSSIPSKDTPDDCTKHCTSLSADLGSSSTSSIRDVSSCILCCQFVHCR